MNAKWPSIVLAALSALALDSAAARSAESHRSTESHPIRQSAAGIAADRNAAGGRLANRVRLRTPRRDPIQQAKPWEGAERIVSNGGDYVVFLRTDPSPIPQGTEFTATVWVFARNAPDQPLADVSLDVDAFMPEHGHGMNRVPEIKRREDGGFDAKGLLLHMGGNWELYLDVTRGPITERAQRRVVLE